MVENVICDYFLRFVYSHGEGEHKKLWTKKTHHMAHNTAADDWRKIDT